jgi:hypothetical protein
MKRDSLDLHGVRHKDVPRKVDEFMNSVLLSNFYTVEIITGLSDRMEEIVTDTLDDYNLEYEIGDIYNPGYITVKLK